MLSMYAERKSVNEVRVRLNLAKGSDEANMLSWDGVRFDEFILSDQEATNLGVPTPTFGEGERFEPKVKSSIDYCGAVSTLAGLCDGPKVMAHPLFLGFRGFSDWMLRQAFSNNILSELDTWNMYTCGDHLHIACKYENGDVDNFDEKLGFRVYTQLSDEEKAGADAVANMVVEEIFPEGDISAFTEFVDAVLSDLDEKYPFNYDYDGNERGDGMGGNVEY